MSGPVDSRKTGWAAGIASILIALLTIVGCGDGGDDTSSPAPISGSDSRPPAPPPQGRPDSSPQRSKPHEQAETQESSKPDREAETSSEAQSDGHGAADFEEPGGDNSIQRFGSEAPSSELAEATKVLRDYLDARIAKDWARMCADLSRAAQAAIQSYGSGSAVTSNLKEKSCAEVAGALLGALSPAGGREAAVVGSATLREKGNRGYLLFRGAHAIEYFVAMEREHGQWKLGAPTPALLSS